jgi:hypothetical protein
MKTAISTSLVIQLSRSHMSPWTMVWVLMKKEMKIEMKRRGQIKRETKMMIIMEDDNDDSDEESFFISSGVYDGFK